MCIYNITSPSSSEALHEWLPALHPYANSPLACHAVQPPLINTDLSSSECLTGVRAAGHCGAARHRSHARLRSIPPVPVRVHGPAARPVLRTMHNTVTSGPLFGTQVHMSPCMHARTAGPAAHHSPLAPNATRAERSRARAPEPLIAQRQGEARGRSTCARCVRAARCLLPFSRHRRRRNHGRGAGT